MRSAVWLGVFRGTRWAFVLAGVIGGLAILSAPRDRLAREPINVVPSQDGEIVRPDSSFEFNEPAEDFARDPFAVVRAGESHRFDVEWYRRWTSDGFAQLEDLDTLSMVDKPSVSLTPPTLTISGVVLGRKTYAVVSGIPGITGSVVVAEEDSLNGVAVLRVFADSVRVRWSDSTWFVPIVGRRGGE